MNKSIIYIFILVVILIIISIIIYNTNCKSIKENFELYKRKPYDEWSSGLNVYYNMPIYRKPYMYPFKFYSSYPFPHMRHHSTIIPEQ